MALLVEGRLAFYGPAKEARAYFDIEQMVGLYSRLKERPAAQWRDEFARSETHRERIEQPLAALPAAEGMAPPAPPHAAARGAGALRQLAILTARYFETVVRDGRNALLLVGQAPLIAGLIGLSLLYGPATSPTPSQDPDLCSCADRGLVRSSTRARAGEEQGHISAREDVNMRAPLRPEQGPRPGRLDAGRACCSC